MAFTFAEKLRDIIGRPKEEPFRFEVGEGLENVQEVLPGPRIETLKAIERGEEVRTVSPDVPFAERLRGVLQPTQASIAKQAVQDQPETPGVRIKVPFLDREIVRPEGPVEEALKMFIETPERIVRSLQEARGVLGGKEKEVKPTRVEPVPTFFDEQREMGNLLSQQGYSPTTSAIISSVYAGSSAILDLAFVGSLLGSAAKSVVRGTARVTIPEAQNVAWHALGKPTTIEEAQSTARTILKEVHPDLGKVGASAETTKTVNDALKVLRTHGIPKPAPLIQRVLNASARAILTPAEDIARIPQTFAERLRGVIQKPFARPVGLLPGTRPVGGQPQPRFGLQIQPVEDVGRGVPKRPIPPDLQPLAQEARKFKTAEEFVNDFVARDKQGAKITTPYGDTVPLNKDGTITLYHRTTPEIAQKIKQEGLRGTNIQGEEGRVYFTTNPARGAARAIGKEKTAVLKFEIDPRKTNIDEVYRDGTVDLWAMADEIKGVNAKENVQSALTKSQLTDIWKEAVGGAEPKVAPMVAKPSITPRVIGEALEPPTFSQIQELGKRVDELQGVSIEELSVSMNDIKAQLESLREQAEQMPGKKLQQLVSKSDLGIFDFKDPDFAKTKTERQNIIGRNKKIKSIAEAEFEKEGIGRDFDSADEIQSSVDEYLSIKEKLENVQEGLETLREKRITLKKGVAVSAIGVRQRRAQYNAVQERWALSDSDMRQFLHGRNISAMDELEWREFTKNADAFGEITQKQRIAMNELQSTIETKELKKVENLQVALDLPPLHQMDTEQLKNFDKILNQYEKGDEFLPVRMLQTIEATDLAGTKTTREVLEVLAIKMGKSLNEVSHIKIEEFHRMLGDRRLGRQHPFLQFMVERKNRGMVEANARIEEVSDEIDGLVKAARGSRKRGLLTRAVPMDDFITQWLETSDDVAKKTLEKNMTPEEMAAVKKMDEVRRSYYEYLVARHAGQKFSRFEGEYFPHVRRGFLEAWKDDGIVKAFLEMRDKYNQDKFVMNILNEKTGDILPYEKWIGFAQFRSGQLIPTKNAAKAFESYITALEKARHLDAMVPEVMAYVHALSPRKMSERGIELDESLKKFVKEYINANKGRVPKGFFIPGGTLDTTNRSLMALTRMLDLGWNFTTQLAAPIGENLMTLTMLKPKQYAVAQIRARSGQSKVISEKYKAWIGRTPWDEMTRAATGIGDKLMAGAFAIYGQSTRQANRLFLLGRMTEKEFKTGIISSERLAQLRLEMSKYRSIKGMESILGRTTEVEAVKQYKSWAIPIATATGENAFALAKIIRRDGVAAGLSSDAGKELFYSIGIGSAILLLTAEKYRELKKKKNRTIMEDITFKAMRDAVSIFGAFDPTMWSGVRVADFIEDVARASYDLITWQTYAESGELKAPRGFQRIFTPSILKRFGGEKEKSEIGKFKSSNPFIIQQRSSAQNPFLP